VGAAWIFTRSGNTWTQQGSKLVGTGASGYAQQGSSVSLSADGNTAIVGGNIDNGGIGAAWVYVRSESIWTQQGIKLVGTGTIGRAFLGSSVSLSADGNTAIIGGYQDNSLVGAAWVFTRNGNAWTQQGSKLTGSDASSLGYQGTSVSLSADGNTSLVGGYGDNVAWVYTRNGSVWTQQGNKLTGSGAIGGAGLGLSVSLSADGNTAIVGGAYDNSSVGAIWVYTRSGSVWTQQGSKLVGTGLIGNAYQGSSVFLSADGTSAIEGGWNDNTNIGAAWVFIPNAAPTTQVANISFANISSTQMDINWTNGNGTNRVVFVKQETGTITNPSDYTTYTASINWATKGTELGTSGYYCVYNGTGNSIRLTGLNASTQYTVQVFEYNGSAGNEIYFTAVATNNPNAQITLLTTAVTDITTSKPNVYPNPTTGLVTLNVPDGEATVLDMKGKVLIVTTLSKDKKIDLTKYDSGMYILILKTNDTIYEYKIMKQ
jgi:hypothetical protein